MLARIERTQLLWRRAHAWSGVCFLLFGLSASAQATTLVKLSLEQMTGLATRIVHARVLEQHSEWNPEHTRIFTYTTLEVVDSLKGQSTGHRVLIKQFGGRVDHLVMHVDGEPQFQRGEEAVLFLVGDREEPEVERIVGMAQGRYRLERDPATQREFVVSSPEGAAYFDPRTKTFREFQERIPLEEFKQNVRRLIAGGPEGEPEGTQRRPEK